MYRERKTCMTGGGVSIIVVGGAIIMGADF